MKKPKIHDLDVVYDELGADSPDLHHYFCESYLKERGKLKESGD